MANGIHDNCNGARGIYGECLDPRHAPCASVYVDINRQLLKTLTGCQDECTRLLEENRRLQNLSHSEIAWGEQKQYCVSELDKENQHLKREIEALKKEYDEEVISHDIEEKGLKEQRNAARLQYDKLVNAVSALASRYIRHDNYCQQNAGNQCNCGYYEKRRVWKDVTGIDV